MFCFFFWNFVLIGYPFLPWSSAWRLLSISSSNSGRFTNGRARLCLQGMKFTGKMYHVFVSKSEFAEIVGYIRTKMQIFALSGHDKDVCSVFTRPTVRHFSYDHLFFFRNHLDLGYRADCVCNVEGSTSCYRIS